jgi:hypothetical protein
VDADTSYYIARARVERQAAAQATHANVRRVHLELANAYEQRVQRLKFVAPAVRPRFSPGRAVLNEQPCIVLCPTSF